MKEKKPRRLRRLVLLAAIVALVAIAITYVTCGHGFGLGGGGGNGLSPGSGSGSASGSASTAERKAPVPPCQVRVDATGIHVDGKDVDVEGAVAACKAGGADVLVTGDALQGTWEQVDAAFERERLTFKVRKSVSNGPP